ncbi:MAG: ureF2 [Mycobacterium sp.]|nr:ureF2 [Mycobacterium sp.]
MPGIGTDPATDVALLSWLQLHDSAMPAGRLVHSHGFEEWLARRPEADAEAIESAVIAYLEHAFATMDATITAGAWRAYPAVLPLLELDDLASTYKLSRNARTASVATGRQLAGTAQEIGLAGDDRYLAAVVAQTTAGHCAVVEGALQARLGIPLQLAVAGSIRSMLAGLLSVAVRTGRLGPLRSQRIQHRNVAAITKLAREAAERDLGDLSSTAPTFEISGMCHETRTARLFAT